ncbi:subclass B1 metallo-beta-lactamase [Taibaiella koreensis]|uniref:subclass B1 metallo-beta-lactamase n=1 Tax=Taibaiella koreensis TaxID=1268548 RepID=UPI000E5A09D8|nr:subclass B1 metallo-beta-lactamase [Taibaiella koreensis]
MRHLRHLSLILILWLIAGQAGAQQHPRLQIAPLDHKHFFIYTTYGTLDDGSTYPSNSLYAVTTQGIVMIDVPWDTTQTLPLIDSIERLHKTKVIACIATHFHKDRTAGLNKLKARGIRTYATRQTDSLCALKGEERAAFIMGKDTTFRFGDLELKTFYPGPGHTSDNIVVWFPRERVLYGGCFIKSIETENLGNLEDADPASWPASVKRVQRAFPHPKYMIPGHGSFRDLGALQHTATLAQQYVKQQK